MSTNLLQETGRRRQRPTLSARFHRARARRETDGGFTLVETVVTMAIVTTILAVVLGVVTNLFQQSTDVHDTMSGVQQDQTAGEALTQYLHSTILIETGSNATTLNASILAGVNGSETPQTATLSAVLTNSVSPKLDATFTISLTPDGGHTSSVNTYDAVNTSAAFTYYYNNYATTPVGLASTSNPTVSELSEIVAVGIDVTFLAGPHVPTVGYQAIRASTFQTTVYLQNASGAPAPTTAVSVSTSGTIASGQPLNAVATVSPVPDGGTMSFTVTNQSGTVLSFCTTAVAVSTTTGQATCTFTPPTGGDYYVLAAFSGTADFQPSTSSNTEIVVPITTTISITSVTVTNNSVTVNAAVSPAAATGNVAFTVQQQGGCGFGGCTTYNGSVPLSSGTASFTQGSLNANKTYNVTATYGGVAPYSGSGPASSSGTTT
jgi:type II secretory pathway pseudopilin PulG